MDAEMKRMISREIARQLNIITSGEAGNTTMTTEDIANLYPGHPTISARPVSFPYGFASRAPVGTLQVTAQQGAHAGNKLVLGHRDAAAPQVDVGESVQYSVGGYQVRVQNGDIYVGKGDILEHMVVGETLKAFLIAVIQAIVAHTHEGNLGYETSPPLNAETFTEAQSDYLDNDMILASDEGRFA